MNEYTITMSIHGVYRKKIDNLVEKYRSLIKGKETLLQLINEAEVSESVYNSNAIENSTLTLPETEKILLELEVSRNISVREVFEAKNLAKVMEYVWSHAATRTVNQEMLLFLHQMLLNSINDEFAGRFREKNEFVRVGSHIAPAPANIQILITEMLDRYDHPSQYFIDAISRFHLDFETTHPFVDGNGRIGRVLINFQLVSMGLPPIILLDKEKHDYYASFKEFQSGNTRATKALEKIVAFAFMESIHKRIAYLEGRRIVTVREYAEKRSKKLNGVLNQAKRQTIPAFREKGVWKIGM